MRGLYYPGVKQSFWVVLLARLHSPSSNSDLRPPPSSDLSARLEIILPAAYPSENVAIAGSLGRVHQRRGAPGPSCTINPVLSGATYMPTQFFSGRYPIQRVGTSLPGRRPANRTR